MAYLLDKKQLLLDLHAAFSCAKRHKSNKPYVLNFEKNLDYNLDLLADELLSKTYEPKPSTCFIIERPKKREVFAANFRDRIVHHLYFNYVHIMFERTFIQDSYSCIENRGTHYGINRLKKHILKESRNYTKPCYVLKLDKRGYFMHINKEKLLKITTNSILRMSTHRINNKTFQVWADLIDIGFVLWLTEEIIKIDPTNHCRIIGSLKDWEGLDSNKTLFKSPKGCGLPIGNLASQLLSNVYLNVFDQFMKRKLKCKHYGRYVDDSYVVSNDKSWILSIIPEIKRFLLEELDLELNMGKLRIIKVKYGVEFLGAFIKPYRTYISNSSIKRINYNINKLDFSKKEKIWQSVNSFLGILNHYSSFNIRKTLFLKQKFLEISIYNKGITKMYPI